MRALAEFTKTTLIGGLLIILPIYIAVLLLAKAVKGLLEILSPVAGSLPAGVEFRQAATIILLIAVCFVVGLVVRTRPGLRAKNAFEQAVLEKLPGYTFFRGLAQRLTGRSEEHSLEPIPFSGFRSKCDPHRTGVVLGAGLAERAPGLESCSSCA